MDKTPAELVKNPLIDETSSTETASRCSSAISYFQETLTISNTLQDGEDAGDGLSRDAVSGLYFLLECVKQALDYESQPKPKGGPQS